MGQQQAWHNQRLLIFNQSEYIGFGLKELNLLHNTFRKIAFENFISYELAKIEFFRKVEMLYNVKLQITILCHPDLVVSLCLERNIVMVMLTAATLHDNMLLVSIEQVTITMSS